MTSSLVGSEMCIRDRQDQASGITTRAKQHQAAKAKAGNKGKVKGKGPVSYTHLTLPTICSV
eukprot:5980895-Prorocentrum_lima.AAC.1